MGTTDDPSLVLGVLHNILENGRPDTAGRYRYLLGEISGLSETAELRILKKLHDDEVLKVSSYTRSNGVPYPINDDLTNLSRTNQPADVLSGSVPTMSISNPVFASIVFDKEKIENEISNIKKRRPVDKSGRALRKDENGDYRFRSKPLLIENKPLDHGSLHYTVLDILYEKGNQDGKVSLSVMEKELNKRIDDTSNLSPDKLKKAVDNAIANLFRRTKIGGGKLEKILPDGRHLITTYKQSGRFAGWLMNNPSA